MKRVQWLVVAAMLALAGCTPDAGLQRTVRVLEGGLGGGSLTTRGRADGCAVTTTDNPPAGSLVVVYRGERCLVDYATALAPAAVEPAP